MPDIPPDAAQPANAAVVPAHAQGTPLPAPADAPFTATVTVPVDSRPIDPDRPVVRTSDPDFVVVGHGFHLWAKGDQIRFTDLPKGTDLKAIFALKHVPLAPVSGAAKQAVWSGKFPAAGEAPEPPDGAADARPAPKTDNPKAAASDLGGKPAGPATTAKPH